MNLDNPILQQVIAGILVVMVVAAIKVIRKKIRHFFLKHSSLISNKSLPPLLNPNKLFVDTNLLYTIRINIEKEEVELKDQNENSIKKYLPKVHIKLLQLWNGAIQTYYSNNPDQERQFMCSIRELFTHLLHILAPDNDIKNWTSEISYFHEEKPTRKARIEYILRNITGRPLAEFKKCETKAAIEFINILNEGTHGLESQFLKEDMILMKIKTESTLTLLLEIEFQVNR